MTTEARTETQGENELALLTNGEQELAALHARIEPHFRRAEVRERVGRFLRGLLSRIERKNGWQLAEELDESGPQGVQRLLNAAEWDEDAVRDELRAYVMEHLEEEQGVLVVDETGFVKKGRKSVGVARQYSGTAGRRENSQMGVFLLYSSAKGQALTVRSICPRNGRRTLCAAGKQGCRPPCVLPPKASWPSRCWLRRLPQECKPTGS